jgi:hypothetical protein
MATKQAGRQLGISLPGHRTAPSTPSTAASGGAAADVGLLGRLVEDPPSGRSRSGRSSHRLYGAVPAIIDLPDPEPGPGQVLIQVSAAGVNPMDRSIAEGLWQAMIPAEFPLILDADVAGVVDVAGEGTTGSRRATRSLASC